MRSLSPPQSGRTNNGFDRTDAYTTYSIQTNLRSYEFRVVPKSERMQAIIQSEIEALYQPPTCGPIQASITLRIIDCLDKYPIHNICQGDYYT